MENFHSQNQTMVRIVTTQLKKKWEFSQSNKNSKENCYSQTQLNENYHQAQLKQTWKLFQPDKSKSKLYLTLNLILTILEEIWIHKQSLPLPVKS